ncbi:MAG: epoxyqueuosine reductase QueH [Eubacteriales bacterium]|nr:epoxyqueuosine reductase QueH [Eubacteriales bacterium]MDY3332793.1 epoxyqueuosine reductase QueH [Gallibacter sp.]
MNTDREKKKILLHSCCGVCANGVINQLKDDYDVTIFFYNPNITDEDEYLRRKTAQLDALSKWDENIDFVEGIYNTADFFEAVKGYETKEEGEGRCSICFKMRLEETAKKAKALGFDLFSTTLTVSPHKSFEKISKIGNKVSRDLKVDYLDGNFKKNNGFKNSMDISKQMGIYRQNYCGCEFSKWFNK